MVMKPETKRSGGKDEEESTLNLSCMKHAIDSIDSSSKEKAFNLSSLAVALSVANRQMKRTEMMMISSSLTGDHYKKKRKSERRAKFVLKKKLVIGMKPETNAELQRWFSNFDESFKRSLFEDKYNLIMPYKVPPKPKPKPKRNDEEEPHICRFNTDCSRAFF